MKNVSGVDFVYATTTDAGGVNQYRRWPTQFPYHHQSVLFKVIGLRFVS
ncbi:hypothetical protein [Lacticaseibacillus rhamnosus]|nr:hypothetical protein [Lacticaseibacillus rhamnosus]AER65271.1 conserved hypothetical protein [Lacticaseibacillus rhamnosus ATCC 8530]